MQPTVPAARRHQHREQELTALDTAAPITCLGCGCACDDLRVSVADNRVASMTPSCSLASAWIASGSWPSAIRSGGANASLDSAIAVATSTLTGAHGRLLVVVAPGLVLAAHREVVALTDALHATIDSATSASAADGILAAQRRGRPGATLGEVRNRANVVLYWGIDPAARYPRFNERYALAPAGTQVPTGRAGRTVIGVSIGADTAAADADHAIAISADQELTALSLIRALVRGTPSVDVPPELAGLTEIVQRLVKARYVAFVHDAEPGDPARSSSRTEGLITLVQALNGPTRAALISLRAGGNRNGFESVLTWQTGFPMAVDFSSGVPTYNPAMRGLSTVSTGRFTTALVVGDASGLEDATRAALSALTVVAIGPRASEQFTKASVAIDTGSAGIHETGIAYRMDDVPLPVSAPLSHPVSATATLATLRKAVVAKVVSA